MTRLPLGHKLPLLISMIAINETGIGYSFEVF